VRATTVLAVVVLMVLAGCGDGGDDSSPRSAPSTAFADQPGNRILKAAYADMTALKSVRMMGTTASGDAPVTFDVVTDAAGDCKGSLTIGLTSTQLMESGRHAWIKPDLGFLAGQLGLGEDTMHQVGDRWIAYARNRDLAGICHLDRLTSGFADKKAEHAVESVTPDRVNGIAALRLVSHRGGKAFTTWVAAEEPHHVLKLDVSDAAGGSLVALTFSAFDEPFVVTPPRPSQIARVPGLSTVPGQSA
jgi:hypothetical protein